MGLGVDNRAISEILTVFGAKSGVGDDVLLSEMKSGDSIAVIFFLIYD